MILSFFITDMELRDLAEKVGLEWEYKEVTRFESAYHNQIKEIQEEKLCVLADGQWIEASRHFRVTLKETIFKLLSNN